MAFALWCNLSAFEIVSKRKEWTPTPAEQVRNSCRAGHGGLPVVPAHWKLRQEDWEF